jgi:hypothetical protein
VDYSPITVEGDEEALVKEERWPEAIPSAVPPPIFLHTAPYWLYVSWFSISASVGQKK